jgi:hypothetical protein
MRAFSSFVASATLVSPAVAQAWAPRMEAGLVAAGHKRMTAREFENSGSAIPAIACSSRRLDGD